MAINLSDILLVSDVDETLVEAPAPIPPRNIEAIRRFTEQGGRFAIATGRSVFSTKQFVDQLPVNAPCVLFNGSGIYDYAAQKMLTAEYLPASFRQHIVDLCAAFPAMGAVVLDEKDLFSVAPITYTDRYLSKEKMLFIDYDLELLKGSYLKVILTMDPKMQPEAMAFLERQNWQDVHCVRSSPYFIEMLPLHCNKGNGLRRLSEMVGIPLDRVAAIGDYDNDLEMLQTAGYPVTVADAPDRVKQVCKLVVGHCMDGAVADLIEHLETHGMS